MNELQPNEFIIRTNGDVKEHFEKGAPMSIEVTNPREEGVAYDYGALSYIKLIVKKINGLAQMQKDLDTANAKLAQAVKENDRLNAELVEVKKERDSSVRKNMQVKKAIFEILT